MQIKVEKNNEDITLRLCPLFGIYAFKKPIFLLFCCEGGRTAKCTQQTLPRCSNNSSSNSFPVPSAISSKIEA